MSAASPLIDFPADGLVPKTPTGASSFLDRYPEYDGRNVVVAIFDTGCDPSSSGLIVTSTGQPKYIDFIDASGSGDVNTSVTVTSLPGDDGLVRFVSPLSSRSLILPAPTGPHANARGVYHVGVKRAYEMYPPPLVARMQAARKRVFDDKQRVVEQELNDRLAKWDERKAEAEKKTTTASTSSSSSPSSSSASSYPSTFTASDRADLESRLAEVRAISKSFDDSGPVFDVIAFHASTPDDNNSIGWFVMVDSTCTGDFTNAKLLTNYRDAPSPANVGTFGGIDMMNYTINVYESGNVVSIVTTAGSHGTHVAGIVAAAEERKEHCGIAPGAQLVSIKIGDSRLGSMETGTGLMRGLIEAVKLKQRGLCDVINMSYGEASSICNSGRITDAVRSAVFDSGVVFVSSAGNNGPAISTSGTPGATESGVISVGAYVSPSMSAACYSSRRQTKEGLYSWSSRGPTMDGAAGVTIAACGGAITTVCEWQLQKSQLMNGTSMSSPAAAGGIALLISGLKARGIAYTPMRIKSAIENTARSAVGQADPLGLGCGLLQIDAAFEHLVANADRPELDLNYSVTIGATGGRGVYIRDAIDASRPYETTVTVEAIFKDQRIDEDVDTNASDEGAVQECEEEKSQDLSASSPTSSASPTSSSSSSSSLVGVANPLNYALNQSRISFSQKVALVTSVDYIDCASHVMLMHGGRSFVIIVHPERVAMSGVHFTEILGYDTKYPREEWSSRGPLFRVPVTVVKSEDALVAHNALVANSIQSGGVGDLAVPGAVGSSYSFTNLLSDAGAINRRFVTVPEGAAYAEFNITLHSLRPPSADADVSSSSSDASADLVDVDAADPNRTFMFHALYLQPENSYSDHESNSHFVLSLDTPQKQIRMNVAPGATLEVTVAQFWSSLGKCKVDVNVQFHGVILVGAGGGSGEVVFNAADSFVPVHFRSVLRNTKLSPSACIKKWHVPLRPTSNTLLPLSRDRDFISRGHKLISSLVLNYSFELKDDSSCVRVRAPLLAERLYESVFESQLSSIFTSDKKFCFATDAFEDGKPLKSGSYLARIQVRHDDLSVLEKLRDLPVVLEYALSKSIDLPLYASYTQAALGGSKFGSAKSLKAGKVGLVYLGAPDAKSVPSGAKPGEYGTGILMLAKVEGNDKSTAGGVRLKLMAPLPATAGASGSAGKKGSKSAAAPAAAASDVAADTEGVAATSTDAAPSLLTPSPSLSSLPSAAPSSLSVDLRDMTIELLNKLKCDPASNAKKSDALANVLPLLLAQFPACLPLLLCEVKCMYDVHVSRAAGVDRSASSAAIIAKARSLLNKRIDQTALLAHFGRVIDKDDSVATQLRKDNEDVRKTILAVYAILLDLSIEGIRSGFPAEMREIDFDSVAIAAAAKATATAVKTTTATTSAATTATTTTTESKDIEDQSPLPSSSSSSSSSSAPAATFAAACASFHSLLADLGSWIDLSNKDARKQFHAARSFQHLVRRQYGSLLKQISADQSACAGEAATAQRLAREKGDLLAMLDAKSDSRVYKHIVEYEKDNNIIRYPSALTPC